MDGEAYLSHRGEKRNIVMTLGFSPHYGGDESVQALRNVLYEYAMPGNVIEMHFFSTDLEPVKIKGRVEAHEPSIFSEDPENQISILCMRPTNFQSLISTVVSGAVNVPFLVPYPGSKNSGFVLTVEADNATTGLTLQRLNLPMETLSYEDVDYPLQSGDRLKISTVSADKYANLTRFGGTKSVLGKLGSDPKWVELRPGDNAMVIHTGLVNATFTLEFTSMYGGI